MNIEYNAYSLPRDVKVELFPVSRGQEVLSQLLGGRPGPDPLTSGEEEERVRGPIYPLLESEKEGATTAEQTEGVEDGCREPVEDQSGWVCPNAVCNVVLQKLVAHLYIQSKVSDSTMVTPGSLPILAIGYTGSQL